MIVSNNKTIIFNEVHEPYLLFPVIEKHFNETHWMLEDDKIVPRYKAISHIPSDFGDNELYILRNVVVENHEIVEYEIIPVSKESLTRAHDIALLDIEDGIKRLDTVRNEKDLQTYSQRIIDLFS